MQNGLCFAYKQADEKKRKKACEALGVPYIRVGDEKLEEPKLTVSEARRWLSYEAHRLMQVVCREDIVKIYDRPMTEDEGRRWAKVTANAIRVILQDAGLTEKDGSVIVIDQTQETSEVLEAARRMECFKQCSKEEILRRLLLKGLEMEGYLKDTKGA